MNEDIIVDLLKDLSEVTKFGYSDAWLASGSASFIRLL